MLMKCSITYSGNWVLVMRWFNPVTHHLFTDDVITLTTSDTIAMSRLTVAASADLQGSRIACLTFFKQLSTPLSINSSTTVPSYSHTWTTPTLNVVLRCKYNPIDLLCSDKYCVLPYLPNILDHECVTSLIHAVWEKVGLQIITKPRMNKSLALA